MPDYRGPVALFKRPAPLPATVRQRLALPRGEKTLASAELTDGRWAVAGRGALYLVGEQDVERRPWVDVDRASYTPESSAITVFWVDGSTQELSLGEKVPVAFAQTLRERVQSSVVHVETVDVPRAGRVRVALRRDAAGELLTQVIGGARVDLTDPQTAAVIDAAESRVRAEAGLRV